jgi:hypothetical protein
MIFTDPKCGEQGLEEAKTALLHRPEASLLSFQKTIHCNWQTPRPRTGN